MPSRWLQLDLYEMRSWKCVNDSIFFLIDLKKDLDEVRVRIIRIKSFPTIQEAFSEVRKEDSRKTMMMTNSNISSTIEGLVLYTHSSYKKIGLEKDALGVTTVNSLIM
ncbi:UBN2_3 domain-containing protein [Gossypium australe]|uniref:UBN2_3 domain-containing protein n=1 Tax=Gossypium australe TaxID=47621 RepID=A0A5B6V9L3_9ROSI|nr:UBN2_3 domain-containing protein [Gossypium australe]